MGGAVAQLFAARYPERRPEPPAGAGRRRGRAGIPHPRPAWWELLSSITAPMLVVAGGPSGSISQGRIHALTQTLDAELVRIGVGHRVHRQTPDRFAEVVA